MKKHLTDKQADQIQKRQLEHLETGEIGLVVSHSGQSVEIETAQGTLLEGNLRQNLPPIVVGDRIVFERDLRHPREAVVLAHEPRASLLYRAASSGHVKLVAANLDQVLIVIAPEPKRATEVLDRYLVMTRLQGLEAVIVFNKIDLLSASELRAWQQHYALYEAIGYPVLFVRSSEPASTAKLIEILKNKTSVFVGLSGVGKSSLIGSLLPDEQVQVGELSMSGRIQLGKHTTSRARLYGLPSGGSLIDSPGIRELGLHGVTQKEIEQGFIEFAPYLSHCKFSNCLHQDEPGCAILEALSAGKISQHRWEAYVKMLE